MRKESPQILKNELRKRFLTVRNAISEKRRREAALGVLELLKRPGAILSFYSFGKEIDLSLLNAALAKEGRLMANRLEQGQLVPYHVSRKEDLTISSLGISEPDPDKCIPASLGQIALILVPGLAFDLDGYRLGYGKGYYDRFLAITGAIPTLGVAFKEQRSKDPLPRDPWDVPIKDLMLF